MSKIKGQKKDTGASNGGGETTPGAPGAARAALLARLDKLIASLIEWGADASINVSGDAAGMEIAHALGNIVYLQSATGNAGTLLYLGEGLSKIGARATSEMWSPTIPAGAPPGLADAVRIADVNRAAFTLFLAAECIDLGHALSSPVGQSNVYACPVARLPELRGAA